MNNMNSMFDMFSDIKEISEFDKESKVDEKKKVQANTKVANKDSKKNNPAKSKDQSIEDEIKKLLRVEVKVFVAHVKTLDTPEDLEAVCLDDLQKELVELGYMELSNGVTWNLVTNEEKTNGVLVATYKFFNKG